MAHDDRPAEEIALEATAIANAIEAVVAGHSTTAVYVALAMVLGASAADAREPDLERLIGLIFQGARPSFEQARAAQEQPSRSRDVDVDAGEAD